MISILIKNSKEAQAKTEEILALKKYQFDAELKKKAEKETVKNLEDTVEDLKKQYDAKVKEMKDKEKNLVDQSRLESEKMMRQNNMMKEEMAKLEEEKNRLLNMINELTEDIRKRADAENVTKEKKEQAQTSIQVKNYTQPPVATKTDKEHDVEISALKNIMENLMDENEKASAKKNENKDRKNI